MEALGILNNNGDLGSIMSTALSGLVVLKVKLDSSSYRKETSCRAQSNRYRSLGYLKLLACLKHLNFMKEGSMPLLEKEYQSEKSREGSPKACKGHLKGGKQYRPCGWPMYRRSRVGSDARPSSHTTSEKVEKSGCTAWHKESSCQSHDLMQL